MVAEALQQPEMETVIDAATEESNASHGGPSICVTGVDIVLSPGRTPSPANFMEGDVAGHKRYPRPSPLRPSGLTRTG